MRNRSPLETTNKRPITPCCVRLRRERTALKYLYSYDSIMVLSCRISIHTLYSEAHSCWRVYTYDSGVETKGRKEKIGREDNTAPRSTLSDLSQTRGYFVPLPKLYLWPTFSDLGNSVVLPPMTCIGRGPHYSMGSGQAVGGRDFSFHFSPFVVLFQPLAICFQILTSSVHLRLFHSVPSCNLLIEMASVFSTYMPTSIHNNYFSYSL